MWNYLDPCVSNQHDGVKSKTKNSKKKAKADAPKIIIGIIGVKENTPKSS